MTDAYSKHHSLFISDLHLSDQRPDITQAFKKFCVERVLAADALYILGDLSDAWLGDDDDSAIAGMLRETLKTVVDNGVEIFMLTGNRDFLMGLKFADYCGLTLLDDPATINLYGQQVLLMHGDSLCTDDTEYMKFRAQIRDPDMQEMLLDKPLSERREIAKMLREHSRSANATKAADIMDVNLAQVISQMQEHSVQTLIHGHTHRPHVHSLELPEQNIKAAKRYVLGDWDQQGWCITADKHRIDLESFPLT